MIEKQTTSLSLLDGLRDDDPVQWERFVDLYSPLVYEWCRRGGVPRHDAADVVQEVFRAVVKQIARFRRTREQDSFQGWLWGITRFKVLDHFRSRAKLPQAVGGTSAQIYVNDLADEFPESPEDSQTDQDRNLIYKRALGLIKTDFEAKTWTAFWQVAVNNRSAKDVADELQMSVGAVYNAKYKVLTRLKTEFSELL